MNTNVQLPDASRAGPPVASIALTRYSAFMAKNERTGRLNIYVSRDPWRRVKHAAAAIDVSVSEYCGEAIMRRLHAETAGDAGVGVGTGADASGASPVEPIAAARRFQAAHFGKSRFAVSTAELLRAARDTDDRVA